jgi:hypothetical protein
MPGGSGTDLNENNNIPQILNIDVAADWVVEGTPGTANTAPKVNWAVNNYSDNAVQIEIASKYRSIILQTDALVYYQWGDNADVEIPETIGLRLDTTVTGRIEIKVPRGKAKGRDKSLWLALAGIDATEYRLVKG